MASNKSINSKIHKIEPIIDHEGHDIYIGIQLKNIEVNE